jgi:hypothetical protein
MRWLRFLRKRLVPRTLLKLANAGHYLLYAARPRSRTALVSRLGCLRHRRLFCSIYKPA